jgi:hypothetical protein
VDLPQNLPLPGTGDAAVAVAAPGEGPGWWAGASSVVRDGTGFAAGYRLRNGHDGNDQTVVARSGDGVTFETVAVLDQSQFGAQWMERPALVALPGGGWRLYTCCGTPESQGWWIDVLCSPPPHRPPHRTRRRSRGSAPPRPARCSPATSSSR